MGDVSAAGDLVMGGLLADAIDPHRPAGQGAGHQGTGGHGICLNCGTGLIGAHCHACGQAAHVHRSIGAIWHEILHGVVHFEGKLWRTLPMLAWRPGELMRRYIDGERVRFVSPMALFLFSVFTLFAVLSLLGISPPADLGGSGRLASGIKAERAALAKQRTEAIADRDDPEASAEERAAAAKLVNKIDQNIRGLDAVQPIVGRDDGGNVIGFKTGWKRLDYGIEKANDNPGLMLYKLQANSYKFSWLLIPLSLPFVWLLFAWRREFHAYDHAVFVTYSIAFMSLLFIALTLLGAVGVSMPVLATIGVLVPPFHIYRQLRRGYRLRRRWAIVRTVLLLFFIQWVTTLFLLLLLGLGLVG